MRAILSICYVLFPILAIISSFYKKCRKYKDSIYWGSLFLNTFLWVRTFPTIAAINDKYKTLSIIGMFLFMAYITIFLGISFINHKRE